MTSGPGDRDTTETATDPEAVPPFRGDVPRRGDVFDRYVIVGHIGAGGMGSVYRAYDPELDRGVAIKLVRQDRVHKDQDRQRILREARAIAKLSHPNVVSVFDVGEHMGAVFVVMELVHGMNLADWAAAEPRTTAETLRIYREAAAGICAAHTAGILHRDIKPRNILVGDDGRVLVADFGLARTLEGNAPANPERELADSPAPYDSTLTHAGALIGSPAYMPPERLAGEPGDARSDQFSFCVSLFETLAGHRPERAPSGQLAIDTAEPEGVPPHVRAALVKGLAHRPDDRFDDMAALLAALEPRRTRSPRALAGMAIAVGVGLTVAYAGFARSPAATCADLGAPMRAVWNADAEASVRAAFASSGHAAGPQIADELIGAVNRRIDRWTASRTQACRATERGAQSANLLDRRMACYDRQLTTIASYRDVWVDAPSPRTVENAVTRFSRSNDGSECAAELILAAPEIPTTDAAKAVTALIDRATARKILGFEDQALELADRAAADAEAVGSASLLAEAHYTRASALSWLKRHEDAYEALQVAAEHASAAGDDRRLAFIVSEMIFQLGDRLGRPQEAVTLGNAGKMLVTRAGGDDALRVHFLSNYGVALQRAGRLEESEKYLREALELRRKEGREDPHELTNGLNRLGNTLFNAGRINDAEQLFGEASRILQAYSSRSTRLSRMAHQNWAMALAAQGHRKRAIAMMLEVVEHEIADYGPDSAELMYPYHNLAWAYADTGDYDLAIEYSQKTLDLMERIGRPQHPVIAYALVTLADAQVAIGRHDDAMATLDRLEAFARDRPAIASVLAMGYHFRGEIYRAREQLAQAEQAYQTALDTHQRSEAPETEQIKPLFGLAQVYWARGRRAEGVDLAQRARTLVSKSETDLPRLPAQIDAWLADKTALRGH